MGELLRFSPGKGNAKLMKLGGVVYTFSLSSGWSCPGANECLSKAVVDGNGRYSIKDGKNNRFRCFSASQEVAFPAVRKQREHNFELLKNTKGVEDKVKLILESIPEEATIVRIHVAGDFFNQDYFDAWIKVAKERPKVVFYAYTKSLNYWVARLKAIPKNFKLNASKGGRYDSLIVQHGLKYAEVVYSEQEALDKGLEIDHDDTKAFMADKNFALLLHGVQPAGSVAAQALKDLKGVGSYSSKKSKKSAKISK